MVKVVEIVRYSTPTYRFISNIDLVENCEKFRVVFTQFGREVFEKTESDIEFNGNTALLKLTQEETALFYTKPDPTVKMTVRNKLKSGEVPPAKEFLLTCKGCEDEEVL